LLQFYVKLLVLKCLLKLNPFPVHEGGCNQVRCRSYSKVLVKHSQTSSFGKRYPDQLKEKQKTQTTKS